jgi:hypothetical protein
MSPDMMGRPAAAWTVIPWVFIDTSRAPRNSPHPAKPANSCHCELAKPTPNPAAQ